MTKIYSLKDTADRELEQEFMLFDGKINEWFVLSTGCSNRYSLQQATFILGDKLRNCAHDKFIVTNIDNDVFYEGDLCYYWFVHQPASILYDLIAQCSNSVLVFHNEDNEGKSIYIEKIENSCFGKVYIVR